MSAEGPHTVAGQAAPTPTPTSTPSPVRSNLERHKTNTVVREAPKPETLPDTGPPDGLMSIVLVVAAVLVVVRQART